MQASSQAGTLTETETVAANEISLNSQASVESEAGFMDDLTSYANKAVSSIVPGMDSLGKMLQGTAQQMIKEAMTPSDEGEDCPPIGL